MVETTGHFRVELLNSFLETIFTCPGQQWDRPRIRIVLYGVWSTKYIHSSTEYITRAASTHDLTKISPLYPIEFLWTTGVYFSQRT